MCGADRISSDSWRQYGMASPDTIDFGGLRWSHVKTGINKPMIEPLTTCFPGSNPSPHCNQRPGGRVFRPRRQGDRPQKARHGGVVNPKYAWFMPPDALREGYEVFHVIDAVGGTSLEAHEAGLRRLLQAGGRPTTRVCGWPANCSATGPHKDGEAVRGDFVYTLGERKSSLQAATGKADMELDNRHRRSSAVSAECPHPGHRDRRRGDPCPRRRQRTRGGDAAWLRRHRRYVGADG